MRFLLAAFVSGLLLLGGGFAYLSAQEDSLAAAKEVAERAPAPIAALIETTAELAHELAQEDEPQDEPARSDRPEPTFYKYVDASGSVKFVGSLDEVPPQYRKGAGKIDVKPNRVTSHAELNQRPQKRAFTAPLPIPQKRTPDVTVYSAPWCGWCRKTIAWLDERGVRYTNKDIDQNPKWKAELKAKSGGTGIPFVEIGNETIRGFSAQRMEAALSKG